MQSPQFPAPAQNANAGDIRNAKIGRGCGGCGCAWALLSAVGGIVLIGFGSQRATREAMPFGIILSGQSLFWGLIGAVLLFWGMSKLKKLGT